MESIEFLDSLLSSKLESKDDLDIDDNELQNLQEVDKMSRNIDAEALELGTDLIKQEDHLHIGHESFNHNVAEPSTEDICNDRLSWFRCFLCNYQTHGKYLLRRHLRLQHDGTKYTCYFCELTFSIRNNLYKHLLTHTGEKPFSCKLCSYKGRTSDNFKNHCLNIHGGSNPFMCDSCDYRTSNWRDLKQHKYSHIGEKKFACNVCHFRTNRRISLIRHVDGHMASLRFRCTICSYCTYREKHFEAHMEKHMNDMCNLCKYNATLKGALNYRMVQHACEKQSSCNL